MRLLSPHTTDPLGLGSEHDGREEMYAYSDFQRWALVRASFYSPEKSIPVLIAAPASVALVL